MNLTWVWTIKNVQVIRSILVRMTILSPQNALVLVYVLIIRSILVRITNLTPQNVQSFKNVKVSRNVFQPRTSQGQPGSQILHSIKINF